MKLFTHVHVDLDACSSVWAARQFVPGAKYAPLFFRSANWDGEGAKEGDLILDIDANGKGLKGEVDPDGTVHSCFALIVQKYAPQSDQEALKPIVAYVDMLDSQGSVVRNLAPEVNGEARRILSAGGLVSVVNAFRATLWEDWRVVERMEEVFCGILETSRSYYRTPAEAAKATLFGDNGEVALIKDAKEGGTTGFLTSRGVQVIVYVDGHNLGVLTKRIDDLPIRMDHPAIRAVVEAAGEEGEWFSHSRGFLYCRGSRKAPREGPSRVDPEDLARAAVEALRNPSGNGAVLAVTAAEATLIS